MSKILSNMLDQSEEAVAKVLKQLEELNGHPSHDSRLLAEVSQALRVKLNQLGLDPDDTTSEELYHSLIAKYDRDSRQLDKTLGINKDDSFSVKSTRAAELITHAVDLPERWALKHSVLRKILRDQPPAQTMKRLHYRSLESMLRRENLSSCFLVASCLESAAWHRAVAKKIEDLNSTDYEMRPLKIACLPDSLAKVRISSASGTISSQVVAATAIWPSVKLAKTSCLSLLVLNLQGLEELNCHFSLAQLTKLNPLLKWWAETENLLRLHQPIVSLNLKDVALNHLDQKEFNDRINHNGQKSFWQKLCELYDHQPSFLDQLFDSYTSTSDKYQIKLPVSQLAPEYVEI